MSLIAGAAVRELSPEQPMALYGYPHTERIAKGIHDPILASALYLNNEGGTQKDGIEGGVALIALDGYQLHTERGPEQFRSRNKGLQPYQVLLRRDDRPSSGPARRCLNRSHVF